MRASIFVFYIAVLATSAAACVGAGRPRRALPRAHRRGQGPRGGRDLERAARQEPARLRVGVEAGARATYWLGGHDEPSARRGRPRARRRGRPPGQPARTVAARGLLLDGRLHGPARRVVRHAPGAALPRRRSRKRSRRCCSSTPPYQNGSADRALGRWYYKVPGLFGGSKKKSEEHLRKSLTYDPQQRGVALLPGRDPVRARSRRRRDRRAAARDRRARQPRVGARGPRVQAAGGGTAEEGTLLLVRSTRPSPTRGSCAAASPAAGGRRHRASDT